MGGGTERRRKVARFTALRRARYLEILAETGNRTAAAEAIGFYTERVSRIRKRDPGFDRGCEEALATATRKLAAAPGAFSGVRDGAFETIRRGRSGRAQIIAVGPGRWSKQIEDRFFLLLGRSGNVEASARAVGFAGTDMFRRRRQWADFAQRWDEALEDAETRLEFRLACSGNCWADDAPASPEAPDAEMTDEPFDREFALKYLKWREEKRRGGGRRGRLPAPMPIEEVRAEILRKLEAIARHEKRNAGARGAREGEA